MAPLSYLSSPLLPLLEMVILFFLYVQVGPPPISSSGRLLREERRKGRRKARDGLVKAQKQEKRHTAVATRIHTPPLRRPPHLDLSLFSSPPPSQLMEPGGGGGARKEVADGVDDSNANG